MANPVADTITVTPNVVPPGGAYVVRITAHDPDQSTGTIVGVVTDAAGHTSQIEGTVTISDPLTFSLQLPAGHTSVPRVGQPGVFDCVAP
jgi:hypothetical protein